MSETELRKLYIELLSRAYRCVSELSTIRRSAQVLTYLNRQESRKLFESRDTGKLHDVLWSSAICHIVVRIVAACFEGGPKKLNHSPEEWSKLIHRKEYAFSYVVAFLSHHHLEAQFVKRLAVRNHAFARFAKNNHSELMSIGLSGGKLPFSPEDEQESLSRIAEASKKWLSLRNDSRFKKLIKLRNSYFAHNDQVTKEWLRSNGLKVTELVDFVDMTWIAASNILSLLLYGVVKKETRNAKEDMDRLLLPKSTSHEYENTQNSRS